MPMKITNAILLLLVCVICATFNMQLFGGLDEMMGDKYWVVDSTQGDQGWYAMGLLPHLKKMPRDVVNAINTDDDPKNDLVIYAQSGDFAGNSLYGISFGFPLIMYLIWFAFIIGFPDKVDPYLLPRRLFTISVIICCSVIANLFLMRITGNLAHTPMSRIANIGGYNVSLLFHTAGIWFAILFSALGTHNHSYSEVMAPDSRTGKPRPMKSLTGCSLCWVLLRDWRSCWSKTSWLSRMPQWITLSGSSGSSYSCACTDFLLDTGSNARPVSQSWLLER